MKILQKITIFILFFTWILPSIIPLTHAAGVDTTNKWAWGADIGWVNFDASGSLIDVTGTGITGQAWSQNYGWIYMQPTNGGVTNTTEGLNGVGTCKGNISGTAWNTNLGWIDFDGVSIDSNGYFSGTATGTGSGPISMSGSNHVVQTDWVPDCVPPTTPTCTTSPSPANADTSITTTCTGVEVGTSVTIPDMVCSPSPATSTTVTCIGTVGTGSGQVSTPNGTVTVTDESGNTNTSETTALVIDNTAPTAPTITSPTAGEETSDTSPTITGTGTPGDTITVTGPLGETCSAIVSGSGSWSCDISPSLAEGPNTISVTATDPAGNESSASTVSTNVDSVAPATPVIANPTSSLITDDNTPTINGTGEPGSVFTLTDGSGGFVGTGVVDSTGNWSFVPTTALPDGSNTINAVITDAAGNTSSSTSSTFTVDTTAPTPPVINTPANGGTTSDNTPTATGTGEPGSVFTLTNASGALVGTGVVDSNGDWTFTPTLTLPDGSNTFNLTLTDAAGNTSSPTFSIFTVDTTAPSTPAAPDLQSGSDTGSSNTDDTTSDTTPTFDVACSEIGSTITLYNGTIAIGTHICTSVGTETVTASPTLGDGVYNITYTETDTVGNESPSSPNITITIDTTASITPTISTPTPGDITNDNTPTINGTGEPGSVFTLTNASGALVGTGVVDSNGDWTYTPTTELPDGGHLINAITTDVAGNISSSATTTFTVDTIAPTPLSVTTPINESITNDNTPTISGIGEPGSVFTLTNASGALIGTGVVDSNGDWTYTPTTGLSDGSNTFNTTLTDAAGNLAGPIPTTFTIDTIAPSTPTVPDLQSGSDTGASNTDGITSDTTPSLDVACSQVGGVITLYSGTGSIGTHTCTSVGTETATVSPALSDGVYNITYTETDIAGNESTPSPNLEVTVDTTAPSTPTTPDLQSGSDTGSSNTDDATSDTTPSFDVTCSQAGTTITLYDGGTPIGTHTCTSVGTETATVSPAIGNGTYDINYTETDTAGNESTPSSSIEVIIDTILPTTSGAPDLQSGSDTGTSSTDGITSDTTPSFDVLCNEVGAVITLYSGTGSIGTHTCTSVGTEAVTVSPALTDGVYNITYTETDTSGNESTPSPSLEVTIDTTLPTTPTITSPTTGSNVNNTTPTVTGTGSTGDTITVTGPLGETCTTIVDTSGNWSCSIATSLVEGPNTISIISTDPAGNLSLPTTVDIDVDVTLPIITLIGANPFIVNFSTTFTDPGATASDSLDGDLTSSITASGAVDTATLGVYTVTYTVTDSSGNQAQVTRAVHVVNSTTDTDNDGIPDVIEEQIGTNPTKNDTDDDGTEDSNNDLDSVSPIVELQSHNNGDANGDGTLDAIQNDVTSIPNIVNTKYNALAVDGTSGAFCNQITHFSNVLESNLSSQDNTHNYQLGLWDIRFNCDTVGATAQVKIYLDTQYDTSKWIYKKHNGVTNVYTDISSIVTYTTENVGTESVTVVNYQITDGGIHDEDGTANGSIIDPSGPAIIITGGGGGSGSVKYDKCHGEDTSGSIYDGKCGENEDEESENELQAAGEEELVSEEESEVTEEETLTETIEATDSVIEDDTKIDKEVTIEGNIYQYSLEDDYSSCPIIDNLADEDYAKNNNTPFSDIQNSAHIEGIKRMKKTGVVDGTPEGNFEPYREITRVEFLKIVLRSHCYEYRNEDPSDLPFTDLDKTTWEAKVIKKGVDLGIVNGDKDEAGNRVFRGGEYISKIEATKILLNMARVTLKQDFDTGYGDIDVSWQEKYVEIGERLGVFSPTKENYEFNPDSSVIRDDMVYFLLKIVYLYREKSYTGTAWYTGSDSDIGAQRSQDAEQQGEKVEELQGESSEATHSIAIHSVALKKDLNWDETVAYLYKGEEVRELDKIQNLVYIEVISSRDGYKGVKGFVAREYLQQK